jgi:hypothetical protein
MNIKNLIEQYRLGKKGEDFILWHKKGHKNGSGEMGCVRGIHEGCAEPVNCSNCYICNDGGFCLNDCQTNYGFLAVEAKHSGLVLSNSFGAYTSIEEALENHPGF